LCLVRRGLRFHAASLDSGNELEHFAVELGTQHNEHHVAYGKHERCQLEALSPTQRQHHGEAMALRLLLLLLSIVEPEGLRASRAMECLVAATSSCVVTLLRSMN